MCLQRTCTSHEAVCRRIPTDRPHIATRPLSLRSSCVAADHRGGVLQPRPATTAATERSHGEEMASPSALRWSLRVRYFARPRFPMPFAGATSDDAVCHGASHGRLPDAAAPCGARGIGIFRHRATLCRRRGSHEVTRAISRAAAGSAGAHRCDHRRPFPMDHPARIAAAATQCHPGGLLDVGSDHLGSQSHNRPQPLCRVPQRQSVDSVPNHAIGHRVSSGAPSEHQARPGPYAHICKAAACVC